MGSWQLIYWGTEGRSFYRFTCRSFRHTNKTSQLQFKAVKIKKSTCSWTQTTCWQSSYLWAFGNHHKAEKLTSQIIAWIYSFVISKWEIIYSQEQQIMTSIFPSTSSKFPSSTMRKALVYRCIVYTVMVWLILLSGKWRKDIGIYALNKILNDTQTNDKFLLSSIFV